MTIAKIVSVRGSCCKCQQNVNYMQQMLNGWVSLLAPARQSAPQVQIDSNVSLPLFSWMMGKTGYTLGDWDMGC